MFLDPRVEPLRLTAAWNPAIGKSDRGDERPRERDRSGRGASP